jgi:CO/xanthine dehydrogenase Mo-binding subunit
VLPANLKANPRLDRWVRIEAPGTVRIFSGKVELGQGVVTAMAQIAAEELDVAPSRIVMVAGDTASSPDEWYTAGSLSMEQGGSAMRMACAEVRQLFLEAAARKLEVSAADLEVDDGAIRVPGTDLRTSYWDLATDVPLSRDATGTGVPKSADRLKLVGTSLPRRDLPGKLSGAAYVHDMELPGMLHGRVLRPPTYGARLESLDTEKIKKLPGVLSVTVDGSFVGVCAAREEQAVKAVEVARGAAKWREGPALPTGEFPMGLASKTFPILNKGASTTKTLEASYSRPYLAHASIGPSCALAWLRDGKLTVWSHTQGSFQLRGQIARVLGMRDEDVNVIHRDGAGCYGHNGADDAALDAALLARAADRPVRVQWSREDELAWSPFGSAMRVKMSAALDDAGRVLDWRHELWSNPHVQRPGVGPGVNLLAAWHLATPYEPSPPADPPYPPGAGARNSVPAYDFPSEEIVHHLVTEQPLRVSALRALGAYANVFAIESFMDELAFQARKDPLAFRLEHLSSPRARAVLEAVGARWNPREKGGEERGRGIGFAQYKNASAYCAVIAEIEVSEKIRVRKVFAAVDAGRAVNPDGIRNQVEGGIVQAASWTLKEQVSWDRSGVLTRSWEDYPILRFDEIPEIEVEIIDRPGEPSLGTGECAAGPTAAAIGNALFHALGVRVRDLPLTPERIAAAM